MKLFLLMLFVLSNAQEVPVCGKNEVFTVCSNHCYESNCDDYLQETNFCPDCKCQAFDQFPSQNQESDFFQIASQCVLAYTVTAGLMKQGNASKLLCAHIKRKTIISMLNPLQPNVQSHCSPWPTGGSFPIFKSKSNHSI